MQNTIYSDDLELSYDTPSSDPGPRGAVGNTIRDNIIIRQLRLHPDSSTSHDTIMDFNLYSAASDAIKEYSRTFNLSAKLPTSY